MSLIDWQKAVELLKNNAVVALPTETVYGLAGSIDNEEALKKIFSTKARPFFDPLIVHVKDLKQAQDFAHWDPISIKLAEKFWPGPLTLVLPKKSNISDLITSGGPTVALRQPQHPLFLKVLENLNAPLAAPSANRFGQTSPTNAEHVLKEFDHKVSVVDGGSCVGGIESTVVEYSPDQKVLNILRPGLISGLELLKEALKHESGTRLQENRQNHSPGNLKNHYQPQVPFFLILDQNHLTQDVIDEMARLAKKPVVEWALPSEPEMAARELYKNLREFSANDQPIYLRVQKKWNTDLWKSLLDRIHKASFYIVSFEDDHWKVKLK